MSDQEELKAMTLEDQNSIHGKRDEKMDAEEAEARRKLESLKRLEQESKKPGAKSAIAVHTRNGFFDLGPDQRDELLKRPPVYVLPDEVHGDEIDEDQVLADGPWLAVALENGEWVTGELVGTIDDAITLRKIHSLDEDGITYWDTTVETHRVVVWHTLEGDRWALPSQDESISEPEEPDYSMAKVDPLTGFPRRVK